MTLRIYTFDATFQVRPAPGPDRRITKEDRVLSQIEAAVSKATVPNAALRQHPEQPSSEALLDFIITSLDDDKAEDVVSIDLRGKSEIADYMVVCSGRSSRQVAAIAEKLADRLKQEFSRNSKIEGKGQGDWVLIDAGDVIIHVFRPEVREFYQLEKMWMSTAEALATARV